MNGLWTLSFLDTHAMVGLTGQSLMTARMAMVMVIPVRGTVVKSKLNLAPHLRQMNHMGMRKRGESTKSCMSSARYQVWVRHLKNRYEINNFSGLNWPSYQPWDL